MLDGNGPAAIVHDNNPLKIKQEVWDLAPIKLLVETAGGFMVNFELQPIAPFNPEPTIVARSLDIAEEIVRLSK